MPCERYRDALTDAAAGEPVAPALAAHLEGCAVCRSELQALRRLMTAADDELSALATAEPSPALRARIRAAAAESGPGPAVRWGFAWTATAAAVLALAAFGAWRASVAHAPSSPAVATNAAPTTVPRPRAPAPPPSAPAAAVSSAATSGSERLPSESNNKAASARSLVARRPRRTAPEVMVSPGAEAALLQYVALVHQQKASPTILLVAGQSSKELREPEEILIEPLELVPLDPADASGT